MKGSLDQARLVSLLMALAVCAVAAHTWAAPQVAAIAPLQDVSIQINNPDVHMSIRVRLDDKVVFDATPLRSRVSNVPTVPAEVGPFHLVSTSRHHLMVEAGDGATTAQLKWTQGAIASSWIVIHYYPGRRGSNAKPFFTFSLQDMPQKQR